MLSNPPLEIRSKTNVEFMVFKGVENVSVEEVDHEFIVAVHYVECTASNTPRGVYCRIHVRFVASGEAMNLKG